MHDSAAAIDSEEVAGGEGAHIGGEEVDGLGHLVRLTGSSERVGGLRMLQKLKEHWITVSMTVKFRTVKMYGTTYKKITSSTDND